MSMKTAKALLCVTMVTNLSTSAHAESIYDSYGLAGISVTSADAHEDERAGFFQFLIPIVAGVATIASMARYAINVRSQDGVGIVMQEPPDDSEPSPTMIGAATLIAGHAAVAAAPVIANHAQQAVRPRIPACSNGLCKHLATGLAIVASGVSAAQGTYAANKGMSKSDVDGEKLYVVDADGSGAYDFLPYDGGKVDNDNHATTKGNLVRAIGSSGALALYPDYPKHATAVGMVGNVVKAVVTRDPIDAACATASCAINAANIHHRNIGHGGKMLVGQVASSCVSLGCSVMGHTTNP